MENKKNLSTGAVVALAICLVLVITNFVIEMIQIVRADNMGAAFVAMSIVGKLSMISVFFYAFTGYKKPHGNILRNTFVIYAALCAAAIVLTPFDDPKYITAVILLEVVLIAFMSGKLNKFKQNLAIITIVAICSLVYAIYSLSLVQPGSFSIFSIFNAFATLIYWATLSVSYIIRYKGHKEAGLADK